MKIVIETIPHSEQRYETTGDWWFDGSVIHVRVSYMHSDAYEALVGIHEAIEAVLCIKAGITGEAVDAFDKAFEKARSDEREAFGPSFGGFYFRQVWFDREAEPGDCDEAPYYKQHQLATSVERMMAAEMGVSWSAYEKANTDLYE